MAIDKETLIRDLQELAKNAKVPKCFIPEIENRQYSQNLAQELVDRGNHAYQSGDLQSALDSYHRAMNIYRRMNIAFHGEYDIVNLQNTIDSTEKELGLHIIQENNQFGYADVNDKIVIPCTWKYAKAFSEGLASVMDDNGFTGYINYLGKLVIPCQYDNGYPFDNGMAYIEKDAGEVEDIGEVIPHTGYIDMNGTFIGCDMYLSESNIRIIYETRIMFIYGQYEEAINRLIPVAEENDVDITPIEQLVHFYIAMKQYDKVVEWCKKIEDNELFSELYAWPKIKLGECYEKGLGVVKDLMEASHWYNMISKLKNPEEVVIQERNNFIGRHPELKDLIHL